MTAYELVMAYHHAWTSGDLDTAMGYLAEDFVCHAPSGEITGREAYRASLGDFAARLTGIQEIAQLSDPDHVVLLYYPQTESFTTAPAVEYFTIRDGKIAETLLVFDRLSVNGD